jgi:hypothetical protein
MEQSNISSNNFVQGDFDFKLQALQMHMMGEIMAVLTPILTLHLPTLLPRHTTC